MLFYLLQLIAEETREIVEKEEAEALKKAMETQSIAEDAQRDLGNDRNNYLQN